MFSGLIKVKENNICTRHQRFVVCSLTITSSAHTEEEEEEETEGSTVSANTTQCTMCQFLTHRCQTCSLTTPFNDEH